MNGRIVIASGNAGKLAEFRGLLAPWSLDAVAQSALGITDADETGLTFVENALIKARHAARSSGLPALADDSGLVVDALGGAPGLRSARYAGGHGDAQANMDRLLKELAGVPAQARTARFVSVIVLLRHAEDPLPLIAQGSWEGRILETARGSGGFGYDPLFLVPELGLSAAELAAQDKNRLSHRGKAMAALAAQLSAQAA